MIELAGDNLGLQSYRFKNIARYWINKLKNKMELSKFVKKLVMDNSWFGV